MLFSIGNDGWYISTLIAEVEALLRTGVLLLQPDDQERI